MKAASNLGARSFAFARHIYQKLAALTFGFLMVSPMGRRLRAQFAALRAPERRPELRIGMVAHLYYLDLLPEILACRDVVSDRTPLHLTVPTERLDEARRLVRTIGNVVLHPCENRGRDIAPFLALLNAGSLDGYDAVLKLHTKRSPHLLDGEIRRKLLFDMLCGERNATWRALQAFEEPSTGLVGWSECYRRVSPYWMANEERVRGLASQMGAPAEAIRLGFFEGSMFWFRPSALAALRALELKTDDFEPEGRQLDGTLHHALERCFTIAAWSRGFVVRDLKGAVLP